jgi:hypothetical protein
MFGPKMIHLLEEAFRRNDRFDALLADNNATAAVMAPWKDARVMFEPYKELCEKIYSVYSILNRKQPPTFCTLPTHAHLIQPFIDTKKWFSDWREESHARAARTTYVEPGKQLTMTQKNKFFFTEEASDDFIRMLTVFPQFVAEYGGVGRDGKQRYLICRRFSQDSLENRFAKIKELAGHSKLTQQVVQKASQLSEVIDMHKRSSRSYQTNKTNCGAVDAVHNANVATNNVNLAPLGAAAQAAQAAEEAHWVEHNKERWFMPLTIMDETLRESQRQQSEAIRAFLDHLNLGVNNIIY